MNTTIIMDMNTEKYLTIMITMMKFKDTMEWNTNMITIEWILSIYLKIYKNSLIDRLS